MFKTEIQSYVNNLRRRLSSALRPGIGMSFNVLPAEDGGGVIEVRLGPGLRNQDNFAPPFPTLNSAVISIDQTAIGGDLRNVIFGGTNVIMEEDGRIILIKDNNKKEWSDEAAEKDFKFIRRPPEGVL